MDPQRAKWSSIATAALTGLGLGFLFGSIFLVVRVINAQLGPDCAQRNLSPQECLLEEQALAELAKWQGLAAAALALLAAAFFILIRSRQRAIADDA